MILNINQLRTFATAARLKSITEAAKELMVTTPAITMQIRRLEQTLGDRGREDGISKVKSHLR
jgi:DNA-binding transcriptional LysR family regulator